MFRTERVKDFIILFSFILMILFIFLFDSSNIVKSVDEEIVLSESTLSAIVFADSEAIETEDIMINIEFNDELLISLEESAQIALENSTEELLIEREQRIQEELKIKKENELRAYYASLSTAIIDIKDGAVFTYNPFAKSNLSTEQYNIILENTGLAGCGESYYNMEQTYGVNGLFALSVACLESGYGRHLANTNNYYGMRSNSGWMSFASQDANIQYFGKLMNQSWYYGKDILNIGATYCPGTHYDWASKVKSIMANSFDKL